MVVGVCRINLVLHGNQSLKGKRQVLKSIIEKTRNRFNVSVSEVGDHDVWQRSTVAVCAVGTDAPFVNSVIDKTINYIEDLHLAEVLDHDLELVNF